MRLLCHIGGVRDLRGAITSHNGPTPADPGRVRVTSPAAERKSGFHSGDRLRSVRIAHTRMGAASIWIVADIVLIGCPASWSENKTPAGQAAAPGGAPAPTGSG